MAGITVYDPDAAKASQSKSIIRKYADLLTFGGTTGLLKAGEENIGISPVKAAVESVRETGEALVVGSALGVVNATVGLDKNGMALDAIAGGTSTVLGIAMSKSQIGRTLRTAGNVCFGVLAMRKTDKWMRARTGKARVHGEFGQERDPIMEAGDNL